MPELEKQLMYDEIKRRAKDATLFFSSFDRLTVSDLEELRNGIRDTAGECLVAKKTLVKRYFNELDVPVIDGLFDGPVLLTTVKNEPQAVSKLLVNFAKQNKNFKVTGVYIEGVLQNAAVVTELSTMPSREQLLSSLLSSMQAPITNFVFGLNAIIRNFVVVVNEIKKQKEEQ